MAAIQESPFLCASKEEFLRKATEIMLLSHVTLWSEGIAGWNKKHGTEVIPKSLTSPVARKGFYCCCQASGSPEGNWASNTVTWRITCVFALSFFRWKERAAVFQRVPGNSINSLLSDDLPSLAWGCGPSRGTPKWGEALALKFLRLSLWSVLLRVSIQMCIVHNIEKAPGMLLALSILKKTHL